MLCCLSFVCHTAAHPLSCEMHKQYSNVKGLENAIIDPDGSGPLPPFPVQCNRGNVESAGACIGSLDIHRA